MSILRYIKCIMLEPTDSYQKLIESFHWEIPEFYNIGVDVCDKWAALEPERLALIHVSENQSPEYFSFLDIQKLSNQTANLYRDYGVGIGDRVAVLLPQAPETAYAHVTAYKLGAISIPLFTLFGVEALEYRLVNAGIKAVITDTEGLNKLESMADKLPDLETVFCTQSVQQNNQKPHQYFEVIDFHIHREKQSDLFDVVNTKATDPAFLIYTSGTTGPPKGALHAHQALLGHLPGVEMSHNFIQEDDLFWTPADWAWIGGLFDVLMPAWQNGVAVVSHRFKKFSAEAAFELMERFEIRNAFLPPTALKLMRFVKNPREQYNLKLRSIASAGESVGSELLAWGEEALGIQINEFYGQTEFNMVVSSCNAIMTSKVGWMGKAVVGQELAIVDDKGDVLPFGQFGHIAIKPMRSSQLANPVMFLGYWNNPEATKNKFVGDWFITGDVGEMDAEGYIRFISRDDDIITSSGYRIGPGEIEDCLLGHPKVAMAAVIGVADTLRTEIVKAFIVLNDASVASQLLKEEIQLYVKTRLAAHEYPREIEFVEALAMTATGKIIRHKLRNTLR